MAKGLYAGQAYLHLSEWVLTDTMRVESMSGDMVLHFRTLVPSQPKGSTGDNHIAWKDRSNEQTKPSHEEYIKWIGRRGQLSAGGEAEKQWLAYAVRRTVAAGRWSLVASAGQ
ncbi:hypothetical protein POX_d05631 [Penicillium oxalicum]|uniref:Uncharacterized protein n=1 Tax=Penicillium oxalicum (strain 114-2 / CGMCC 5302) TaxID=933388 RepID=S7ZP94_PENO1|nr:hypothetical protein POX_d05631 [Penicillium oxalicum]EPS32204.1 hypothetical protein PDE_07164 [Penicillium oxalicum 114-2]KAI2790126.1 hypothetical protein POX_d05631 [Penicillium oxalicum]